MRGLTLIMVGATLAGCGAVPEASTSSETNAIAENGFPKAGEYHIIHDVTAGGVTTRYERDDHVDASTREKFERLVGGRESASCSEPRIDIGGGSFSFNQTCNGPSGDMVVENRGTYSKDSIDITYETRVGGATNAHTASYRLKN